MDSLATDIPRWLNTIQQVQDKISSRSSSSSVPPSPRQAAPATPAGEARPENKIAQWRLGKKIGTGSFGVIYDGEDDQGRKIAMKFESNNSDSPQLRDEYRSYKLLAGCNGICNVYGLGEQHLHHYLVMDALGPSLEMLYSKCKRKFSLKTVCMLGIQMIDRIHSIHQRNLIYRDVKPQNFLMGRSGSPDENKVFIVDLGMCKEYIDPITKQHIASGGSRALSGTVQFLSNNAVKAHQQSRRDDLESVCLVLIYFLRDGLPWATAGKTDEVARIKHETSTAALCAGLPPQFKEYMDYIRALGFDCPPDYAYLQGLLAAVLAAEGTTNDLVFDWGKLPVVAAMRPIWYDDAVQKTFSQLHKDIAGTRYRIMRATRTTRFSSSSRAAGLRLTSPGLPSAAATAAATRAASIPPADEHLAKAQKTLVHLSDKALRDSGWAEDFVTLRYSLQRALDLAAQQPNPPSSSSSSPAAAVAAAAAAAEPADEPESPRTRVWRPPRVSRPASKAGTPDKERPTTPRPDSAAGKDADGDFAAAVVGIRNLPASPIGKGSAPSELTPSARLPTMALYTYEAPALEVDDTEEVDVVKVPPYHTGKRDH
ncbi:hypothetical protein TD95_004378 [Thielaviopsis punctulata]|uniref:non-specific serine/threonine protein kinase n=1 Tax=Thielaviopsis punctulata TaxID=72032 RepID=A0A0F4ZD92_9PEZI|nr:hypothetical protein TD95_004378 [Thielaviopsis punctulata]